MSATNKDQLIAGDPLLTAAAGWFMRVQNDDLDVHEIADWHKWLAEDPSHREAFDRMQALWNDLGKLPHKEAPRIDPEMHSNRLRWQWLSALAASIFLAVGAGHLYLSGSLEALLESPAHSTVYATRAGEHRTVNLPDGSTLSIGAYSLAWTEFSGAQRTIVLDRGEAFFEVAKDPNRPFVVKTGGATFTATGTAFNVRKTGERVLMAVSEGTVLFAPKSHKAEQTAGSALPVAHDEVELDAAKRVRAHHLRAGQQVIVEPQAVRVREVPVEAVSAWRDGRLEYLGEPLKYVVADVNRYSKLPIVIDEPRVGESLVTGTVFERDIEAWLRSLEDILPIAIDRSYPERIVLSARR